MSCGYGMSSMESVAHSMSVPLALELLLDGVADSLRTVVADTSPGTRSPRLTEDLRGVAPPVGVGGLEGGGVKDPRMRPRAEEGDGEQGSRPCVVRASSMASSSACRA